MKVADALARVVASLRGRRPRRRAVLVAAASLVVVVLAGCILLVSPVFAVTSVAVDGTKVLTPDQVREAAAIEVGTPLALADVTGAANRVGGLAPVAQVTVRRDWPTTLRILVTERTARLSIAWGHQFLLADASGVVFQVVSEVPHGLIPVAVAPSDRQLIADTGTVYSALNPAVQQKVSEIRATTRDSITIELESGVRVVWGSVDQSELKSQVLDALLPRKASVIDVSAPSNPTTR